MSITDLDFDYEPEAMTPAFPRPGSLTRYDADGRLIPTTPKPVRKDRAKATSPVDVEQWTGDTSTDTGLGLGHNPKAQQRVRGKFETVQRLHPRDVIVLRFLARYRYAWTEQIAYLLNSNEVAVKRRLKTMEASGFIAKQHITAGQWLWMTTKAGNRLAGVDFTVIRKHALSPATIQHTIGIASLAAELEREAGGLDILGERKDDPTMPPLANRYRMGLRGHSEGKTFGEMTVSEREIKHAQIRHRGQRDAAMMRLDQRAAIADPTAPELLAGNENLYAVYGYGNQGKGHLPDLVVQRDRAVDGSVQHIAIELELTSKNYNEWRRIIRWYRDDGDMFATVYYFTHNRAIANAIKTVAEEEGFDRLVVRKFVPKNENMPFWG